jgi:hypothetical protein
MRSQSFAQSNQQPRPSTAFAPLQVDLPLGKGLTNHHSLAGSKWAEHKHNDMGALRSAIPSSGLINSASHMGHDFRQIRVHTGTRSVEPPISVNALISGIGRDYKSHVRFNARVDRRLPDYTPAWTESGDIHLSISSLFMPPLERQKMLRHEAIHSLHQQIAPRSETVHAQEHAEHLATSGEQKSSRLSYADFLHPAPAVLAYAYPPQAYKPWTKVWVGTPGLIGEVVEGGVKVRILKLYKDLKTNPQAYVCGTHKEFDKPDLAERMQKMAKKAAEFNTKIPQANTAQRIDLVVISDSPFLGNTSSFAYANNKGLILLEESDFRAGIDVDTIAHESAHAVFAYHRTQKAGKKEPPDALVLKIADLFLQLKQTAKVPEPKTKFDPKKPPPLKGQGTIPAGIVMVMDTLWSGQGGHPLDNADEFFASAYAGFVQQHDLLVEIIRYYEQVDPKIKKLADQLLDLLKMVQVNKPEDLEKLPAPSLSPQKLEAIQQALSRKPLEDYAKLKTVARTPLGWLLDPSTMPSEEITCPTHRPSKTIEELMEEATKGRNNP